MRVDYHTAGGAVTLQFTLMDNNYLHFAHICTPELNMLNDHAHIYTLQQLALKGSTHSYKTQLANTPNIMASNRQPAHTQT